MKKKVLISLGIIIIVGAVAGGIWFIGGKEKDSSIDVMASVETEPEEDKVDATSGIINNPVNSEETNEKSTEEYYAPVETPEEAEYQNYLDEEAHQEAETPKETTANDELADITPLDKTMYAKGNINTRTGPSTEYTKAGNLTLNESVHVTGQSQSTNWYQLTLPSGEIVYCSNQLLSDTKTEPQQPTNNNSNNQQTNNQQQQTNDNNNVQTPQPEQPSNNTTPVQDTPSAGGIEQGNLGGDNGFAGVIGGGGTPSSDWLGTGNNTPGH